MSSLLLRFAGPAQSWGGPSLFPDRISTELVPTRRGTLGLLAACLGAARDEWPAWLADTRITVRVDRPGQPSEDYHTITAVPGHQEDHYTRLRALTILKEKPKGGTSGVFIRSGDGRSWTGGQTAITKRRFLADAVFMVAIEHEAHLGELIAAVRSPRFVPYLGRKAYPPAFPFVLGTSDLGRTAVLAELPALAGTHRDRGAVVSTANLPLVEILGDRNRSHEHVTVPVTDKEGVLTWATTHLTR